MATKSFFNYLNNIFVNRYKQWFISSMISSKLLYKALQKSDVVSEHVMLLNGVVINDGQNFISREIYERDHFNVCCRFLFYSN